MTTTDFMDEEGSAWEAREPASCVQVVLLYDDLAAGQRAMKLIESIGLRLGNFTELEMRPWSFRLLDDPDWNKAAASDALQSDVLVLASCAKVDLLPAPVAKWVEKVIRRKRGTGAAIVTLFLSDGQPDGDDSPRVASIRKLAAEARLDHFAPLRSIEPRNIPCIDT